MHEKTDKPDNAMEGIMIQASLGNSCPYRKKSPDIQNDNKFRLGWPVVRVQLHILHSSA